MYALSDPSLELSTELHIVKHILDIHNIKSMLRDVLPSRLSIHPQYLNGGHAASLNELKQLNEICNFQGNRCLTANCGTNT